MSAPSLENKGSSATWIEKWIGISQIGKMTAI